MPFSNFKLRNRGFSLVELLLSLSLIGLVVVVALPNLKGFSKTQEADATGARLADILEKAQSSASSHINCPDGIASANWKVVLNASTFSLNCLSTAASPVDQVVLSGSYKTDSNSATAFTLTNVSDTSSASCVPLTFTFTNQQLSYLCPGSTTPGSIWPVKVKLTNSASSKVVVIEKGGVIRVE